MTYAPRGEAPADDSPAGPRAEDRGSSLRPNPILSRSECRKRANKHARKAADQSRPPWERQPRRSAGDATIGRCALRRSQPVLRRDDDWH